MRSLSLSVLSSAVLALAAALAAAPPARAAEPRGIEALPGQRFTTALDPEGDADTYAVEMPAGGRLGALVRRVGGDPGLESLTVEVIDRDGETVIAADTGRRGARVRPTAAAESGTYFVRVSGEGTGAYLLRIQGRNPRHRLLLRGGTFKEGDDLPVPFDAQDRSLLTFVLRYREGLPSVKSLLAPDGSSVPGLAEAVRQRGKVDRGSARVRRFPLEAGTGTYTLVLDRLLGDPELKVRLKVSLPRLTRDERRTRVLSADEPFLESVDPAEGGRGTEVVLAGGKFTAAGGGPRVLFGGFESGEVTVVSTTEIRAVAPGGPAPGPRDVAVVNPDGQGAVLRDAFTYLPPPTITGFFPAEGPESGGTEVTLEGSGFEATDRLTLDGEVREDAPVAAEPGSIRFVLPAHAPGEVVLGVEDEFGSRSEAPGTFRFVAAPEVASVHPPSVPRTGGDEVVVRGSGFAADGTLLVDGAETEFVLDDPTRIRFTAPAHDPARVTVAFDDRFGQRGVLSDGLRFFELADASTEIPSPFLTEDWGGSASLLADIEKDGDLDLVVTSPTAIQSILRSSTRVLRNDSGSFTDVTGSHFPSANAPNNWTAHALATADLAGDGGLQLLVARDDGGANPGTASQLHVLTADADGAFAETTGEHLDDPTPAHDFRARALAVGDLDGDGDTDLVLASLAGFDFVVDSEIRHGTATRVLRNEGGVLSDASMASLPDVTGEADDLPAVAVLLADLDGDGDLDLVLVHTSGFDGGPATRVLRNDGAAAFAIAGGALPAVSGAEAWQGTAAAAADVDGDGDLDLVLGTGAKIADDRPSTRVLLNDGSGVFADATATLLPAVDASSEDHFEADALRAADFNGDGDPDLVLAARSPAGSRSWTRVLLNDGKGTFRVLEGAVPAAGADEWRGAALSVGDDDADGDPDVFLTDLTDGGDSGRRTRLWRNRP